MASLRIFLSIGSYPDLYPADVTLECTRARLIKVCCNIFLNCLNRSPSRRDAKLVEIKRSDATYRRLVGSFPPFVDAMDRFHEAFNQFAMRFGLSDTALLIAWIIKDDTTGSVGVKYFYFRLTLRSERTTRRSFSRFKRAPLTNGTLYKIQRIESDV